jgi:hypothetical protein
MSDDGETPPPDDGSSAGQTRDYEVGYGRPPESGKIKPGEVRNPRGKTKGTRSRKAEMRQILNMPVKMLGADGKTRRVTTHEAALLKLRHKALEGDSRSLDRLLALSREIDDSDAEATTRELLAEDQEILAAARARLHGAPPYINPSPSPSAASKPDDSSEEQS